MTQEEQDAVHREMMFAGVAQQVLTDIARPYLAGAVEILREMAVSVDAPQVDLSKPDGLAVYAEHLRLVAQDAAAQTEDIPEGDAGTEAAFRAMSLIRAFADLFKGIVSPMPKADEHEAAYPAVLAWYAAREAVWAKPWLVPDVRAQSAAAAVDDLIAKHGLRGEGELERLAHSMLATSEFAGEAGEVEEIEDLVAELRRRARAEREAARQRKGRSH